MPNILPIAHQPKLPLARLITDDYLEVEKLLELTPREREVLGLMAEGRSNNGIADALSVELKTVEGHVGQVFRHLRLLGRHRNEGQQGDAAQRDGGDKGVGAIRQGNRIFGNGRGPGSAR